MRAWDDGDGVPSVPEDRDEGGSKRRRKRAKRSPQADKPGRWVRGLPADEADQLASQGPGPRHAAVAAAAGDPAAGCGESARAVGGGAPEAGGQAEAMVGAASGSTSRSESSSVPFAIVDLRNEEKALLDQVYTELLREHFPIADELDDLEDIRANLAKEPDGRFPELHLLVAKHETGPIACCYYEFYPPGNLVLLSYICVQKVRRRPALSGQAGGEQMGERAAGQLDAIFAETHEAPRRGDGVMDAKQRQMALRSLGFRCLKHDYVQPPLSEKHKPCGGLRLLVKDKERLDKSVVIAYLDNFAGSVFDYDGRWKSEAYYVDQVEALAKADFVETTRELPW
ncbi:unnamed protein product [Prorocentrum cordatum]|uniref:Histone acetyltransferase n=1 Tax=Prorocentrum cordatum TaxID=2364126 RepID=A0ABN9UQU9_9DINO|nr:unnamed protein product [Polarella glacialis]